MSSSSFEVNEGPVMESMETQIRADLENEPAIENMEDMSPGTIIFSPQDMKPIFQKSSLPKNKSVMKVFHKREKPPSVFKAPRQKKVDSLTEEQRKAEKVANKLDKYKEKDGPIACEYCGRVMSNAKILMQHMSIHDEFKPFRCKLCPRQFTRKVQLQGHMAGHGEEKQFECPVCHQRFSRKDCVKIHMRIHDKTKCAYCEVCHKSFLTTGALNIHMRIHRGEKPFKCHLCGKCFTQKNHLITHIKRHTNVAVEPFQKKLGPRMFQCDHCPRSFIRLSDYERHVQWNHGAVADLSKVPIVAQNEEQHAEQEVKAPRQLMKERSKRMPKPRKLTAPAPIQMCTSSTQTDDSPGHIIIPRKYQMQDQHQESFSFGDSSSVMSTPRRLEDDGYNDVYDDHMDRDYSSDEEDETSVQTNNKVLTVESTNSTITTSNSERDTAFDAIIGNNNNNNNNNNNVNKTNMNDQTMQDPLGNDQPNE